MEKIFSKYIYLFSILFALGALVFFPKWIVDDAYITFRYAENLANHFQLTFNVNDNPVEGYTGIILPAFLAVFMKAGISPVFASHSIGILSFITGGIFLFLLLKKMGIHEFASAVTILLYSTLPIIYSHVFSGLETILFSSVIIVIIYFSFVLLKNDEHTYSFFTFYSLLLLLISLIRPEGVLFSVLISVSCFLYYVMNKKHYSKKLIICLAAAFVIPFTIYFLWRWNYYGYFFPNTYYIKSGSNGFSYESYQSFINFISNYFVIPFVFSLLFILINVIRVRRGKGANSNEMFSKELLYILLPSIIFMVIILLQYFHSNLLMNFSYRFYIPTIPVFLILLSLLLDKGYKYYTALSAAHRLRYQVSTILFAIFLLLHIKLMLPYFEKEILYVSRYRVLLEDEHIAAGEYIRKHFKNDKTLLVYRDAGAIPFFSKLRTIDFGGLNDVFLAHNKINDQRVINYFYEVEADILCITSFNKDRLEMTKGTIYDDLLQNIIRDKRFNDYSLVKIFDALKWNYYQFLFEKKSPQHTDTFTAN